jgi:hypothetical protein
LNRILDSFVLNARGGGDDQAAAPALASVAVSKADLVSTADLVATAALSAAEEQSAAGLSAAAAAEPAAQSAAAQSEAAAVQLAAIGSVVETEEEEEKEEAAAAAARDLVTSTAWRVSQRAKRRGEGCGSISVSRQLLDDDKR